MVNQDRTANPWTRRQLVKNIRSTVSHAKRNNKEQSWSCELQESHPTQAHFSIKPKLVLHPDFELLFQLFASIRDQACYIESLKMLSCEMLTVNFWETLFLIKTGVPWRAFLAFSFALFFLCIARGQRGWFWKLLKYMQQETGEWGSFPVWGGPDVSDQKPVCVIDQVSLRQSTCRRLCPLSPWVLSPHPCRSSCRGKPVSFVQNILQSKTLYFKTGNVCLLWYFEHNVYQTHIGICLHIVSK